MLVMIHILFKKYVGTNLYVVLHCDIERNYNFSSEIQPVCTDSVDSLPNFSLSLANCLSKCFYTHQSHVLFIRNRY